jgi:hypothetical protein
MKYLIILFCASISSYQYMVANLANCNDCNSAMVAILEGHHVYPFIYRRLTPLIIVALGNTPQTLIAFHWFCLVAFFWLLWNWCERWGGRGAMGVLLATVALVVMWPTWFFSAYTVLEWVFLLVGFSLAAKRWAIIPYGALVVIATINRELTGLLLVAAWLALNPKRWRLAAVYAVLFGDTYFSIQSAVGDATNTYTLAQVWLLNTTGTPAQAGMIYNALLSPLWVMGGLAWRRIPGQLRRLTIMMLAVYLPLWATQGIWQETRLLMIPLILLLPVVTKFRTIVG